VSPYASLYSQYGIGPSPQIAAQGSIAGISPTALLLGGLGLVAVVMLAGKGR